MRRLAVAGLLFALAVPVWSDFPPDDALVLREPDGQSTFQAPERSTSVSGSEPFHHLALGVSYLGGQLRWRFSRKWAAEFQYQHGKTSSDYGDVTANVFGLRGYRFSRPRGRLNFYAGPEIAIASAKAQDSDYRTHGMVFGAFGGFDYALSRRFSVGLDIGPYVISLTESKTGISQTNVDFVVNTTLNWHLF